MLYYINGKVYILSGGHYKEVVVEMIKENDYDVKVKQGGDRMEYVHNENQPKISVEEAYKKSRKRSLKEEM